MKTPTLCICAVVKDEADSIEEWILHYKARGVAHMVVIDDSSSDGTYEKLKEHEAAGYVTLRQGTRDAPFDIKFRQRLLYNVFALPHVRAFDWVLAVDADEYLWDPEGFALDDYLTTIPDNVVEVSFAMLDFGDNGHVEQPPSIVNHFTRRATAFNNVKSMARVSRLCGLDVHTHAVIGPPTALCGRLQLNHYKLQSRRRWETLVVPRGSANGGKSSDFRHTPGFFDHYRLLMNQVEDLGLIHQNER